MPNLIKAIRFGAVGGLVLLVDLGLIHLLGPWFPPLMTVSIAYVLAVTVHFLLNKWWVFRCTSRAYYGQVIRYLLNLLACWLCTVGIVSFALRWITPHLLVAKLLAVPPTTLLAFALLRWFVFSPTSRIRIWVWRSLRRNSVACSVVERGRSESATTG